MRPSSKILLEGRIQEAVPSFAKPFQIIYSPWLTRSRAAGVKLEPVQCIYIESREVNQELWHPTSFDFTAPPSARQGVPLYGPG